MNRRDHCLTALGQRLIDATLQALADRSPLRAPVMARKTKQTRRSEPIQ
jgi:hypothetical protein